MLLIALAAAAADPQPGSLKTFADWTVGCDNGLACQAVALVPAAEQREAYLLLVVARDGAPAAPPSLRVPLDGIAQGTTVTLSVDGVAVARLVAPGSDGGLVLPLDRKLAAALAGGKTAALTGEGGKPVRTVSLAGAAAALLYIDGQQQRLGTRDALVRVGRAAASGAPPPLPVVAQPPANARPPRLLSVKDATRLIGPDNARCAYADGPVAPVTARLDATHSVAIVPHPCGNGAYNLNSSVFILDERGRASTAILDVHAGLGDHHDNMVVAGGWDAAARRLTSYVHARGIGDCGVSYAFAWDGARFRIVERKEMGECRGSIDYITTWRARVVTR